MISPQLIDYIKLQISQGVSQEEINKILTDSGWNLEDINQAFSAISSANDVPLPPVKNYDQKYYSNLSAFSLLKLTLNFFKNAPLLLLFGIIANIISDIICIYLIPFVYALPINVFISASLNVLLLFLGLFIFQLLSVFLTKKFKNKQSSFSEIFVYFKKNLIPFLLMNLSIMLTTISGLILFIIPGIIFSFWAYFSLFVYIEEELPLLNSIDKSRFYSGGHTVGKIICKSLFLFLFIIIIFLPINFLTNKNTIIRGIIDFIAYGITASISCIYFYNFYLNIKCQKEKDLYTPKKSTFFIFKFIPIISVLVILFAIILFNKPISKFLYSLRNSPSTSQNVSNKEVDQPPTNYYVEQSKKAKDAMTQNDAAEVLQAYERFYFNVQEYPWNTPPLDVNSPVLFDSTQAGFGICYSDGVCNTSGSDLGILITEGELKPSFASKDPFKNLGTNGENKLWTFKTPGSSGITDGFIYVCYIPKAQTNRLMITKLNCLNNTVTPAAITPAGTGTCVALQYDSAGWDTPTLDGVAGMFMCVPQPE